MGARGWLIQASIGLLVMLLGLASAPAGAQAKFEYALEDAGFGMLSSTQNAQVAYAGMSAVNGKVIRVEVVWRRVAPSSNPATFNASNPADPHYHWNFVDPYIRAAAQRHLKVMLYFLDAPLWAQGPGPMKPYTTVGGWDINPTAFSDFAHALAVRYSGAFPDPLIPGAALPRVQYWELWNEPNIPGYFNSPGDTVSAYRTLLNLGYAAVKAVHSDNVVAIGGLAPVSSVPGSTAPLKFAAQLLCVHKHRGKYRRDKSCPQRAQFDALAIHPYSLATTPTKHAIYAGDVLTADVGKVRTLLDAVDKLHTASPRIHHRLWVTEFSWPTNPPNTLIGDADPVAARYVAYSMYEMWKARISLITWETVLDVPVADVVGRGLYFYSGQPKLEEQGFAFPVVASVRAGQGYVWGRAPVSRRVRVVVQRHQGHRWRTLARVRTGSDGVFQVTFAAHGNGFYRARVMGGPTSLPYFSKAIPPRRTHLYSFFG